MGTGTQDPLTIWRPQPGPQTSLLTCPVFEVFYGGARGGGKTDGVLGEWIGHAGRYGEHASGIVVRRERTQLIDTIERSRQLFGPLGAKFTEHPPRWRFPDGARLLFAYLERDSDAEAYQGHSYTRVYPEEIGNFPRPEPVLKMMATLRSANNVPCRFRATGNPGGPGHQWVKARYVDPHPGGYRVIRDAASGLERVYIPAKVQDNPLLLASDPSYIARLQAAGNEALVKAWLDGDWSVITGAFFPEFSMARHVIRPFRIPEHWSRIRAGDWGSAKPFCILWAAVSDGSIEGIARGALVFYREWYGMEANQPNVGLKLDAQAVGGGIVDLETVDGKRETIADAVLDPAGFAQSGGPSIAEMMSKQGAHWRPADNKRVPQGGAIGGWDQIRYRLRNDLIVFFDTCVHTIRTLPALQHDQHKPEDVDTESEDHAPDTVRYLCMARPIVRDAPDMPKPRFPTDLTIKELIQRQRNKRLDMEA